MIRRATLAFGPAPDQSAANPDIAALNDAGINMTQTVQSRLAAVMHVARYHGVELNPESLRLKPGEPSPTPLVLLEWLKDGGLWARGVPMNFRQLLKIDDPAPVILLLNDGGAALVVGRNRETPGAVPARSARAEQRSGGPRG